MHSSVNTASSGIACAVKCARLSVQYMESSGAVWGSMVASAEIGCTVVPARADFHSRRAMKHRDGLLRATDEVIHPNEPIRLHSYTQ
jgi:hypothetical protein